MKLLNFILNLDFIFWLFFLTLSSGLICIIDYIFFHKSRLSVYNDNLKLLSKKQKYKFYKNNSLNIPFIVKQSKSLFSVFLVVFLIRGFLIGNFLIPTSSMFPTIKVGDFIFVNKIAYGIRSPFSNKVLFKINDPKRGDIVVFRFPVNKNVDFIKRVVGLPGDIISYNNKNLTINGKKILYSNCTDNISYKKYSNIINNSIICTENFNKNKHKIHLIASMSSINFQNIKVPSNKYFVMGDNRDNSEDSCYWGFVDKEDLIGKAQIIWMSWDNINNKVRWNRIGKII